MKLNNYGYSILEMALAISLFSIFMAAVFSVFSYGFKSWKLIETKSDSQLQAEVALARIVSDLKSSDISSVVTGDEYVAFETAWSDPNETVTFKKLGGYPLWQGYILYYTFPRDSDAVNKKLLRKYINHSASGLATRMTDIDMYLTDNSVNDENLRTVARNIYDLQITTGTNRFIVDIILKTEKKFSEKRLAYEKDFSDNIAVDIVTLKASISPRNTP